jgi:hypothetical protein
MTEFFSANRTLVPIRCRVVKNVSDFDGAWTVSIPRFRYVYIVTWLCNVDVGK